jgi:DNA-binding NarL/FixJ family response regulator
MDDMDGWETARRIRARGIVDMPIIMVSANAFEHRPEHLEAAGAQAFVDKPVIESELLVALQRHLEIEWVADLPLPHWAPPDDPALPAPLPPEFVATLVRLARMGHAQGLIHALERLAQEHPVQATQAATLRSLVDRYAFDELLDRLAPSVGAGDAQEVL